ncbi:MAG: glycerol-3-phosphate acyltransferase [Acidimicrobiia bacterium]|jgi:glycerol-3-phosphate acyltransferase PlsY
MSLVALLSGYLIGSIPTAGFLARARGVDLRNQGSRNPGTHNALRTGGPVLALVVLGVEAAKGFGAVWLGSWLGDDLGAVLAGLGAVTGNVYNVWYRFQGGKGLGISLGILAATWPTVLPVVIVVIAVAVLATRSAGLAALAALAALIVSAVLWAIFQRPTGGVPPDAMLVVMAMGMALVMAWKHWRDSPLNPAFRRARRRPVSPDHR